MRAGNQQFLVILAIAVGVLCALSPPTFGDSFSDFETSDARQILADTQAKRVAEAAKQNALIYFVISLVICYVIFPINDQRLLKVVIVIGVTTIGYFGGQWIEERKGVDTDPALEAMERAEARRTGSDMDKAGKRMKQMGMTTPGLQEIKSGIDALQRLQVTSLSPKNIQAFEEQLQRAVPKLQGFVNDIAANSMSMAEFDSKFGGMGKRLLLEISDITGADYGELRGQVESAIRERTIRSPSDKALAAQAASNQLLEWGYSEAAMVPQGGLQNLPMLRAEIMAVREAQKAVKAAKRAEEARISMSQKTVERLADQRDAIDDKATGASVKAEKAALRFDIKRAMEGELGKGNVTHEMAAQAYKELKKGGTAYQDYINSQEKRIRDEGKVAEGRVKKERGDLTAGGLTKEQVQRLLDDTKHYVAVRRRIAELNYALGGIQDHAGVQSAGGIRAIVDRKVEQTKNTPQKNP